MTTIELRTSDGPMPAVLCTPETDPKGAVIVLQEAFGLTDHIADVCQRFADAGWVGLAPSLYHRQGSPVIDYNEFPRAQEFLGTLTVDGIRIDLLTAFDFVEKQGFDADHTAVVGFCAGGTLAFYAATLREIGAAVTFYGSGIQEGRFGLPSLLDLAVSVKCPWLGQYGDDDAGIPIEQVEQLRTAMRPQKHPAEIVRYEHAGHGFHCDARPEAYHEDSARDAWDRTLNWLSTFVGVAKDPDQVT